MKASRSLLIKPMNSFEDFFDLSESDDEYTILDNLEIIPQFRRCPMFCMRSREPARARLVIKVVYHFMNRVSKEGTESENSSWFWYCTECFRSFVAQDITSAEHELRLDAGKKIVQISKETHPVEYNLLQRLGRTKVSRLRGGKNHLPGDSRINY